MSAALETAERMKEWARREGIPDPRDPACNSPAKWFAERFPQLPEAFGDAVLEGVNNDGELVVKDICEPFLAATLGTKASPEAPTVFIPAEGKFYTVLAIGWHLS